MVRRRWLISRSLGAAAGTDLQQAQVKHPFPFHTVFFPLALALPLHAFLCCSDPVV